MTSQFAEINGVKMHYDLQGEGEALVLIHAGVANLKMWAMQMNAFSAHYRVLRYDVRGWGESPDPAGDYTEHGDLDALMEHVGIGKAHILGISNGGRIAIDFAIAYPQRVITLICVAPGLGGFDYPEDKFLDELTARHKQAMARGNIDRAVELEARMWVDGPYRQPEDMNEGVRAQAVALIRETLELPEGEGLGSIVQPPAAGRLAELEMACLLIIGDKDVELMVPVVDKLASEIKKVRKIVMQDVAHLPNMEKPERFNQIVLDFLQEKR